MKLHQAAPISPLIPLLALTLTSCAPNAVTLSAFPTSDPQCPGRLPADPPWVCRKGLQPTASLSPVPTAAPTPSRLASWTLDEARDVISEMEQLVLNFWEAVPSHGNLDPPYSPAWHAVWTAIAIQPSQAESEGWWWKLAYYMAMAGETDQAAAIYTSLIDEALNKKGIAPDALPSWFQSGETTPIIVTPHFELSVEELSVPGSETAYLINLGELRDIDTPGSSCLLVLKRHGTFSTRVLHNGFPNLGFFITERNPTRCSAVDVTGDGREEILVDHYSGGHVGYTTVIVFDLSTGEPQAMPFTPLLPDRLELWNGSIDYASPLSQGIRVFQQLETCDGYVTLLYQWGGAFFEVTDAHIEELYSPYPECAGSILSFASDLPPDQARSVLQEALIQYSQPSTSNPEMLEELRVLQGLFAAYAGDPTLAASTFREIAGAPLAPQSIWAGAARAFLDAYSSSAALYRACSIVNITVAYYSEYALEPVHLYLCSHRAALEHTVANVFAETSLGQLKARLAQVGVQILSDGWFDFDGDNREEWWFVVRHPDERYSELWVSTQSPVGVRAFFASTLPEGSDLSAPFPHQLPVELLDEWGSPAALEIVRDPRSGEPSLLLRDLADPDPIQQALTQFRQLRDSLISGGDPAEVYHHLKELDGQWAGCPFETEDPDGAVHSVYDCASYTYILGLAAELAGDNVAALDYYQSVMADYPDRPLSYLATFKLTP